MKDIETGQESSILEAAEKLFLEKGFTLTTTTEIAKLAGCNQALVHYYFRTKEKLFDSIFEKKIKLFFSEFLKIEQNNDNFESKLSKRISAHFDLLKNHPKLPFLIFNELITNPDRVERIKSTLGEIPTKILSILKKELDEEIQAGRIREISPIDLIITIASLNVMLFIAKPIIKQLSGLNDEDLNKLYEHRKNENIRIIIASIKNN